VADLVVQAQGLGKRYWLGAPTGRARPTLREALAGVPARIRRAVGRRHDRDAAHPSRELWAVRDLTFAVARGEILGIVGTNGSGKTSVLRLVAGITEPSEGWVATRGRVAALLEVGAAFHPDLTGRENIFLSGIVLGMRAAAVRRRFDEIVEFAGTGRLLDTPVKHYSSGAFLRLAFAVAAHLEADLLLVDEMLSVGDLAFREKCLAKVASAPAEGRSVLLVTHSMPALRRLCSRALLLDQGRLVLEGPVDAVARRYEDGPARGRQRPAASVTLPAGPAQAGARGLALRFLDRHGVPSGRVPAGTPWRACLHFALDRDLPDVRAAVTLSRGDGTALLSLVSTRRPLARGRYRVDFACEVPLAPADVIVGVEIWSGNEPVYRTEAAGTVTIAEVDRDGPLARGLILPPPPAEIHPLAGA
jgi:ABC-type polysaccharide/polyol phosphate transport system ATPase subunit